MTAMRAVRAWMRSVRTEIMVAPVGLGTDDRAGLHDRHADDGLGRGAGVEPGDGVAGGEAEAIDARGVVVGHPEGAVADGMEAAPVARRPRPPVRPHPGPGG